MEQTRKQISETIRNIDSHEATAKKFKSRLASYREQVNNGDLRLPQLVNEVQRLTEGLPQWREKVRVLELSLKSHSKKIIKQSDLLRLLIKKRKLEDRIAKLPKEKKK